MRITILLTYRPSYYDGSHKTCTTPHYQSENGVWHDEDGNFWAGRNELETAIRAIQKNSVYKHKIILTVDKDIFPNKKWLSNFGDIEIFKNTHAWSSDAQYSCRSTSTIKEAIFSLPDDEFISHYYLSDLVCAKYWDKYIDDAYNIYGDDWVYAPMWVEIRSPISHRRTELCGTELAKSLAEQLGPITTEKIWNDWRKMCCHSLTIPPYAENKYIPEKYFDDWIAIASQYEKLHIEEHHGDRIYGYWISLCGRNKIFKKAAEKIDPGISFDILTDNEIVNKAVVTRSFLFHTHNDFKLDNIEVEKIK
jgi:hypothetical protein